MQADLVRRAQEGDHEAFALLAERVIHRLRGTARLLLRDATRADDAVQEALIAAWQHLPSLGEPDRAEAWLNRLLVNACHRAARHDVTRRLREIPIGPGHDRPAADDDQEVDHQRRRILRGMDHRRHAVRVLRGDRGGAARRPLGHRVRSGGSRRHLSSPTVTRHC